MGEKFHAGFWLENLKARDRSVDGMKILKWILNKMAWCGLDAPGAGKRRRSRTFGFHKTWGFS
jgi:hypothetical protein